MLNERISAAKQSSDLTYRSVTRPQKAHDSDVIAACGLADAVATAAVTAAGESGAVYVRDLIKRLTGFLAHHKGIDAAGMAEQVCYELLIDRCLHESETARCVAGAWIPTGEWQGQPANGWPDCPSCLGSGRAKTDAQRRAKAAGFDHYSARLEAAYKSAMDWCAHRLMSEGGDMWRLLK